MGIQHLVCSNCKGSLKWNPQDKTFECLHCGTKFKTDNEFTYRYVNEAKIEEARIELEKKKLDIEIEKHNDMIIGKFFLHFVCAIGCAVCYGTREYVPLIAIAIIWLLVGTRCFGKFKNK